MSTTTIGGKTVTRFLKEESYCVAHSFECDAQVEKGVQVKLNANGTVSPVAAATDQPLGVVTVGNKKADEKVTILTPFVAVVNAEASGAIAGAGVALAANGQNAGEQTYATAVSTNYASAVALANAADGEAVKVGLLRSAYLVD